MDETSVDKHLSAMLDADLIAVDTETTGIDRIKDGRDSLIGISVAYRIGDLGIFSGYFPFYHQVERGNLDPKILARLCDVLSRKPLVWHHRKFDRHSLESVGIDSKRVMRQRQFDCMIEAQMVNEEWPSKELDWLSKTLLKDEKKGDAVKRWAEIYGWGTVPIEMMDPYARQDAELPLRLHNDVLWGRLQSQELDSLWDVESQFTDTLYNMEREGVGVDTDFAERKLHKGRARMGDIAEQLGFDPTPTNLRHLFFEELKFPVLEYTEKGNPSLNKRVMEEYDVLLSASDNPTAQLVLEYRGWQTACGLLYEPTLRLLSPDGRIRTNYKQHGTVTSRLSSSGPNMQQNPRKSEKEWNGDSRTMFNTGCDCCDLWGFDYSQLEFRLGTAYGGDKWLIDTFNDPSADVFNTMSERIMVPRQTCKTFTYGNIYGAGLEKIAYTLNRKPTDIEDLYANFLGSIPGIRGASNRATHLAKQRKFVRYWTGRRRHFAWDDKYYKAFNSILQGGAAELVKYAMLSCREVEDLSEHGDCRMVLQVHDEIVFRIRKGMIDKYRPEIEKRMTNFPDFGVKLAVEGKVWNA